MIYENIKVEPLSITIEATELLPVDFLPGIMRPGNFHISENQVNIEAKHIVDYFPLSDMPGMLAAKLYDQSWWLVKQTDWGIACKQALGR